MQRGLNNERFFFVSRGTGRDCADDASEEAWLSLPGIGGGRRMREQVFLVLPRDSGYINFYLRGFVTCREDSPVEKRIRFHVE